MERYHSPRIAEGGKLDDLTLPSGVQLALVAEGVPVEVVGVADDELAEGGEVAFDRVQ